MFYTLPDILWALKVTKMQIKGSEFIEVGISFSSGPSTCLKRTDWSRSRFDFLNPHQELHASCISKKLGKESKSAALSTSIHQTCNASIKSWTHSETSIMSINHRISDLMMFAPLYLVNLKPIRTISKSNPLSLIPKSNEVTDTLFPL